MMKFNRFLILIGLFLAACSPGGEVVNDEAPTQEATAVPDPTETMMAETEIEATAVEPSEVAATDEQTDPAAAPTRFPASKYDDLEMITLLPPDAIPAIDNPRFLSADEADTFYDPDELVIGVEFGGEARAYSIPFLSNHEIVNDEVGDVKISVTW